MFVLVFRHKLNFTFLPLCTPAETQRVFFCSILFVCLCNHPLSVFQGFWKMKAVHGCSCRSKQGRSSGETWFWFCFSLRFCCFWFIWTGGNAELSYMLTPLPVRSVFLSHEFVPWSWACAVGAAWINPDL